MAVLFRFLAGDWKKWQKQQSAVSMADNGAIYFSFRYKKIIIFAQSKILKSTL